MGSVKRQIELRYNLPMSKTGIRETRKHTLAQSGHFQDIMKWPSSNAVLFYHDKSLDNAERAVTYIWHKHSCFSALTITDTIDFYTFFFLLSMDEVRIIHSTAQQVVYKMD